MWTDVRPYDLLGSVFLVPPRISKPTKKLARLPPLINFGPPTLRSYSVILPLHAKTSNIRIGAMWTDVRPYELVA
jgi:hypothetical protein